MYCTKCGSEIAEGQQFCGACGVPVVVPVMPEGGSAAAPAPARQPRPTAIVLIAALQFIIALLLAVATAGFFSFLMSGQNFEMTPAFVAALAGLVLVVAAAGVSAVGLMNLRPYGRALALAFSCFGLLLFPVGTVVSIFLLRYLLKAETAALFHQAPRTSSDDPKLEPWPMAMKIFAGCMVVSMLALIAFATIRRPPTSVARTTGFPALELGILSEDGQGLVPDADNLSAQDIAAVSLVSTDDGMPEVAIQFTPSGGRKIERLSSSHFGKRLAFLINGKIDTSQAGVITGPLSESVSMSFPSQEEARRFVDGMNK